MASQVQIAKLALQHIGDRYDIADLTEESTEAEQINLVFDDTRDEILRRFPWRFAKKYISPSKLAGITVPGFWDFAYQYPPDAVKVRGVSNPLGVDVAPIDFEIALLQDNTKVILQTKTTQSFSTHLGLRTPLASTPSSQWHSVSYWLLEPLWRSPGA